MTTMRHRPRPLTMGATALVALGIASVAGMVGFASAEPSLHSAFVQFCTQ